MLDLQNSVETPIRKRVAAAERIVVKVGTNVIMRDDGAPAVGLVYGLVEAAVNVLRAGKQILLVSSGAIGLGAKCLKLEQPPTELALKQACAAIGQSRLMSLYQDAFSHFDIATAQILLTEDDFLDPVRYSNLLATLATLLGLGVVPIINENDTVSTLELDRPEQDKSSQDKSTPAGDRVFGDNDKLSALVMTKIDADLLVLLSDVDGLYTGHPSDHDAKFVSEVEHITPALFAYARTGTGTGRSRGRGGMATKIEAARIAVDAGRIAVIANGRVPGIVERVCSGEDVGTVFYPSEGAAERGDMNPVTAIDSRASRDVNHDVSRNANQQQVIETARAAKRASRVLAGLSSAAKDETLSNIAAALQREAAKILSANAEDVKHGEALVASGELSRALFNRLGLTEGKLDAMIDGVLAVRSLPDPAGQLLASTLLDEGLRLDKVSCPLGVLAIIFEARPDAITQISSLAIKSGNAVILKGGKEVEKTMRAILEVIRGALSDGANDGKEKVPVDAVCGVYGREAVQTLLDLTGTIDLVIPRGSNALVQHIQRNTHIPVLGHADGVCHVFIDRAANFKSAIPIVVDSKIQYPAVCNALETVLIHAKIAADIMPPLYAALNESGVKVRGDARTQALLPNAAIDLVHDDEWHTEYSDLIVAIGVVDSLEAAIEHIEQHGSHHTDAILTEDTAAAERFLNEVDSANVLVNCSTRFSDGFRYGFGAEVGISTSKLHARGPVGLEGLVTYKYKLIGSGQVVRDYAGKDARPFLHKRLDV